MSTGLDFDDQRVTKKSWQGYFIPKNLFFNTFFTQKHLKGTLETLINLFTASNNQKLGLKKPKIIQNSKNFPIPNMSSQVRLRSNNTHLKLLLLNGTREHQDRFFSSLELVPITIFSLFNQNTTTLSLLSQIKGLKSKENKILYQKLILKNQRSCNYVN